MSKESKLADKDTCEVFQFDEQKVTKLSSLVSQQNFLPVATIFKAISDETRLKIAYALSQEDELCVCDVAQIIQATNATTSHHLRLLKNLGIAKSRKEGKLVFYSLDDEHVRDLIDIAMKHGKEVEERG
ncbi:metalloregulator ArsR/SmtB family transcription factor [Alkalihalophilus lindianensis]|uniref:Metalloregulator ArsR/SmtB family transcription factor n=1 Tax=Alkalihalophilus lindianensis TaxID=1630542 RepID=A0ABU3XEJ8_9BACI|nr:metalloregulator ArsR/SmtB family transcription factor [Alkalihalophilus lindianensis]MDV2686325.1 metalloregulator ArsR/SmtB family transcription factor [Alkalihalophilus lindianensis]